MAYMSFSPWEAESADRQHKATADDVVLFSPLELRVINLGARTDISRELTAASRVGRLLEKLFGLKLDHPLASPRLEKLRRYASLVRHHPDEIGETDMSDLVAAGFSAGQAHGLFDYFTGRTRARRSVDA